MTQVTQLLPPADQTHPWPEQGQWTYEDYLRLPDDGRRYELIEGVLYMANAPFYDHQFAVLKIASKLEQFIESQQSGVVIAAPFEVHLPGIAKPVQPDILFIRTERQPASGTQIFEGAPDLIVEVLSPGSLRLDQYVKFGAYERAGVREYWIADPKARVITIYYLPENSPEYILSGQFTTNETLQSKLLPGLAFVAGTVFPAQ
ncbi:MAG: Uma2 family endonuclease [Chloroflexi bacterium]|nr:Uma2 family endonuclease [Ardenticatenaceae bacterium]MBL1129993.1 Uma2 family endonuclease [Chloroflexota bacterium]NOG36079.1 Uma2 family endonuclease [Chloroflexota bacterium]GIK58997.1 MAG: restriction endonuclease [Chloroflexota bacterium]